MKKTYTRENKLLTVSKVIIGASGFLCVAVLGAIVICLSVIAFPAWYIKKKLSKNEKEIKEIEEFKLTRRS
jgi:hypothetical protein